MANEVTLTSSLAYADASLAADSLLVSGLQASPSVLQYQKLKLAVLTSNTAIPLGGIASLGFFMAINRDPVNTISIVSASAGIVIATMGPGQPCGPFRFGSGIMAPYAIATGSTSLMEYMLISA